MKDLDRQSADALGLADMSGAVVVTVVPGFPDERVGLKRGDVLVSFNGAPVRDAIRDLQAQVGRSPIGAEASFVFVRKKSGYVPEFYKRFVTVSERRDTSGETRQPQTKPSKGGLEELLDRILSGKKDRK